MEQKIIFTNLVGEAIDTLVADLENPRVFVVNDVNTVKFVMPVLLEQSKAVAGATQITVKAGDINKNLDAARGVWKSLADNNANRNSVIINLGGGMVSDLGGFAAATFKRGIRFVNVPTTLLAAVDASVGGKNGINFEGCKNQIGTFAEPVASIISTGFFITLPQQELLSGYAEMLKHALLDSPEMLARLMNYSVVYPGFDADRLLSLLEESVNVKKRIVDADFHEKGLRKVLNLGHTAGHAFESLAMARRSPISHGFAVAQGCVVALVMSHLELGFPSDTLHQFAAYVRQNYNAFDFTCDDYPELLRYMAQDKKNTADGSYNFTLLEDVGRPRTDIEMSAEKVAGALDIYRDLMGV